MNLKEIKEIITLMNENDLTEIELDREGDKIKIKRSSGEVISPVIRQPIEYRVESAPVSASAAPAPGPQQSSKVTKEIKSPMVGTFYRAPSPESPPFVDVGQVIEGGQVVCIVEAMKLMNEIKSEIRGKVIEVTVENANPVEFGQVLFVLEPV